MAALSLFCASAAQSVSSSAQTGNTNTAAASKADPSSAASANAEANAEDDAEDDPDMPRFMQHQIDPATYLRLRDEQLRLQRGVDDLMLNPQARTKSIRQLEQQENAVRRSQLLQQSPGRKDGIPLPPPLSFTWTPLGPAPIPNGQTDPNFNIANEQPVSGRVTAIAVDPTDPNIVYVGAAQGGVYRSLDGGATWTALMDQAASLAIGAITIDPADHTKVFVGTGESNLSVDSFFGVGVYLITSANTTPVVTGPFNTPTTSPNADGFSDVFTGRSISKILVNPANDNQILVATTTGASGLSGNSIAPLPQPVLGVYLSQNALSATPTFDRITVQTAAGAASRRVTDMTVDPGNANTVLVHVFGNNVAGDGGVWKSTSGIPWNNTATWTQEFTEISDNGRFAVNQVGKTTTFILGLDQTVTCTSNSITRNVGGTLWSSIDGATWSELTSARGYCGGQCFYDIAPALDPTNASNILVGGSARSTSGIGACGSGIIGKSTDGGTTFASSDTNLHGDSHATAFAPSNASIVYAGNDGGIFKSTDGGATWSSMNTAGFNATQFVSFSVHSTDPNLSIGGTQDNGTPMMKPDGSWTRADFGDGGYSAIDQSSSSTTNVAMYHTYFNQQNNLLGFAQVTNTANATEGNWGFFGCGGTPNGINCADAVLFYAPLALGPGTPNTIYYGSDHLYRSADQGVTMPAVSQLLSAGVPISSIGISAQDDNVRIVGLRNGQVWATTNGSATLTNVTGGWTPRYIARTVVDPNNTTTAYVTLDGYLGNNQHVWKTTNLSGATPAPTWAAASNGLPDSPVNAFVVDPANSSFLYAGTDIGVYSSTDGGNTWNPFGTGLPRVAIFDMKIVPVNHTLRVGTHGRGIWSNNATRFSNTTTVSSNVTSFPVGTTITLTGNVNKGSANKTPTGSVTFKDGGTSLGTGNLDANGNATLQISTLTLGSHSISVDYDGDNWFNQPTTETPITVTVASNATTTAVSPVNSQPITGASINLTATVTKITGIVAPTGTVTFFDGTAQIGAPAAINASGVGAIQASFATGGVHNVTAAYSGDANYAASTSLAVAITVLQPDYTVTLPNGSSATVNAGSPATYTLSVTPQNSFSGTVTFSCTSGLPSLASCSFNPATVTGSGNTTLTISTTATTAAPPASNSAALTLFGGAGLFGLVLATGVPRRKRALKSALLFFGILALVGAMVSCGNHTTPQQQHIPGTPAGASTVTVSATSGSTTHTTNITLTVQ